MAIKQRATSKICPGIKIFGLQPGILGIDWAGKIKEASFKMQVPSVKTLSLETIFRLRGTPEAHDIWQTKNGEKPNL